jgi:hypothetical protein
MRNSPDRSIGKEGMGEVSVYSKDQTPLLSLSGTRKVVRTPTNLAETAVTAEVQLQASLKHKKMIKMN